jgi:hypothetical protein
VTGEVCDDEWPNGAELQSEQICHYPGMAAVQMRIPMSRSKIDAQFFF